LTYSLDKFSIMLPPLTIGRSAASIYNRKHHSSVDQETVLARRPTVDPQLMMSAVRLLERDVMLTSALQFIRNPSVYSLLITDGLLL